MPVNNADYWRRKIGRNVERNEAAAAALTEMGWSVLTVWECGLDEGTQELLATLGALKGEADSGRAALAGSPRT